jgi:hypothetical protein
LCRLLVVYRVETRLTVSNAPTKQLVALIPEQGNTLPKISGMAQTVSVLYGVRKANEYGP